VANILVLGGGNGGLAATVDLTLRGFDVSLWNRSPEVLESISNAAEIRYEGVFGDGAVPVPRMSTDLSDLVSGVDLLLVCLPATAHRALARGLAAHLRAKPIILNPGGLLGSLVFVRDLRAAGHKGSVRIGETGTLTYICRKPDPASIRVMSVARDLPFAAFPGSDTKEFAAEVATILPNLSPAAHILAAGLTSINTVLHPPAMILAAAWIERTQGDFFYYYDTATPSVGRLMAKLDAERLAVAQAWSVETESFLSIFARIGSTSVAAAASGDFRRALEESEPNRSIRAPKSLDDRYMHEDIPFGLVPLAELGRLAGVSTPVLDAIIVIASTITGRDFRSEGRNLGRMGLEGLRVDQVLEMLEDGQS